MESKLLCEYKFKFYLNASHYIFIEGKKGETHPHTWEIILNIIIPRSEFVEFRVFEKAIEAFFKPYQNQTMNNIKPFNTIVPTLENMIDYFGVEVGKIIHNTGGELSQIEGSETPTRSYILNYTDKEDYIKNVENYSGDAVSGIIDQWLDDILS